MTQKMASSFNQLHVDNSVFLQFFMKVEPVIQYMHDSVHNTQAATFESFFSVMRFFYIFSDVIHVQGKEQGHNIIAGLTLGEYSHASQEVV